MSYLLAGIAQARFNMEFKDIKDMTISQIEEYLEAEKAKFCEVKTPYKIGCPYQIRTVTMIYTGLLKKIYPGELVITKAAWIPETNRWAESCEKGTFKEVEPYPKNAEVIIPRGGILDAFVVTYDLPTKQQ